MGLTHGPGTEAMIFFEELGKMIEIIITGTRSDFRDGTIQVGDQIGGEFHPQSDDVVYRRRAIIVPEMS